MARLLANLKETQNLYDQHFVYQQNQRIVKHKHFLVLNKKIKPAKCENISDRLDALYKQRRDLFLKYKLLEDKIMFSTSPQQFRAEFSQCLQNIEQIQQQIDELLDYYDMLNEPVQSKKDKFKSQLDMLYDEMAVDSSMIPTYIKHYLKYRKIQNEPDEELVEFVVLERPVVSEANEHVEDVPKPPKQKVKLTENNVKIIKQNLKQLIKDKYKDKFKSKNLEECASRKTSQPYYMKKEDILKVIEENPEIQSRMPPNYKSLNKENLCQLLFG